MNEIFLGLVRWAGLRDGVPLAEVFLQKIWDIDLSQYPQWLVVFVGTLAAALLIWIAMKLLKVALWLLFFMVLIGGIGWAVWLLVQ